MLAAVFMPMGLGGVELLGGRTQGKGDSGGQTLRIAEASDRVIHFAAVIFPVYAALTVMLWVGLLLAGDPGLMALGHAMGTLSTSGISPVSGFGETASGHWGEVLIFIGLFFAVSRRLWPTAAIADRRIRVWQDPELRLALAIIAIVTVTLVIYFVSVTPIDEGRLSLGEVLRYGWEALFTSFSFLTSTGYQSASWPAFGAPGLFLLGLAMIGGGVATAAGGIKLLRVYALLRHGERELERIVHPHSIGGHGPVARSLRREGAYLSWLFFMIFGLSILAVTAALTLSGLGFYDAMVLAIACLTTTGQLANVAGETPISYAGLGGAPMAILGTAMVLGRLEIMAVFALIGQKVWSR